MKLIKKKEKRFRQLPYYIMILPGALYLLINNYIPMAGVFIAFKDIDFSSKLAMRGLLPEIPFCTILRLSLLEQSWAF